MPNIITDDGYSLEAGEDRTWMELWRDIGEFSLSTYLLDELRVGNRIPTTLVTWLVDGYWLQELGRELTESFGPGGFEWKPVTRKQLAAWVRRRRCVGRRRASSEARALLLMRFEILRAVKGVPEGSTHPDMEAVAYLFQRSGMSPEARNALYSELDRKKSRLAMPNVYECDQCRASGEIGSVSDPEKCPACDDAGYHYECAGCGSSVTELQKACPECSMSTEVKE